VFWIASPNAGNKDMGVAQIQFSGKNGRRNRDRAIGCCEPGDNQGLTTALVMEQW
jgi:hypothetical protein